MNCNHMNGERHKGKQRGLNLEKDAKRSGSEGRGQEKKAQWQRWKPAWWRRGQVLKKCKNSPPEAVPGGFSLFKPHLGSSKCKGSQGLRGLFLLWLFLLRVGSTQWWCVLRIESPHPSEAGHLRAAVTKPQWVMAEDWGWGWEEGQPHCGRRRGRKGWWKEPFHRYMSWWSTPCIISLDPHFSLMEERRRRVDHPEQVWEVVAGWDEASPTQWHRDRDRVKEESAGQELCRPPA